MTLQSRTRDEPRQIMLAAASALTAADAAAGFSRLFDEQPTEWFRPGTCRHCDAPLGDSPDDLVIPLGAFGFIPNVCCKACADRGQARLAQEDRKARSAAYSSIIPAEFIWWDDRLGNNAARARTFAVFKPETRRGLILHGTSGGCKTRILWEVVKTLVDLPSAPSWLFLDAYDAATTGFPAEATRADYLFLDDLGNEPTSTKYETALLRLLRKRNDWHKPTLISTQLTGVVFKRRFFEGAAAEAILRRLNERTDKVSTDNA